MGLMINWSKSELVPSQQFNFIGAHFDLLNSIVLPKEENRQKTVLKLKDFLRLSSASARTWQSILGLLASQFRFVKYGRLFLRPLQWHLQTSWDQFYGDPNELIPLTGQLRSCLLPDCTCLANKLKCTEMCKLQSCTNQKKDDEEEDPIELVDSDDDNE